MGPTWIIFLIKDSKDLQRLFCYMIQQSHVSGIWIQLFGSHYSAFFLIHLQFTCISQAKHIYPSQYPPNVWPHQLKLEFSSKSSQLRNFKPQTLKHVRKVWVRLYVIRPGPKFLSIHEPGEPETVYLLPNYNGGTSTEHSHRHCHSE